MLNDPPPPAPHRDSTATGSKFSFTFLTHFLSLPFFRFAVGGEKQKGSGVEEEVKGRGPFPGYSMLIPVPVVWNARRFLVSIMVSSYVIAGLLLVEGMRMNGRSMGRG